MTHTPGPWRVCYDGVIEAGSGLDSPSTYRHICTLGTDTFKEMKESGDLANARLIAAAPELLAELEWHANYLNGDPVEGAYDAHVARVKTIVAKAKGQSND